MAGLTDGPQRCSRLIGSPPCRRWRIPIRFSRHALGRSARMTRLRARHALVAMVAAGLLLTAQSAAAGPVPGPDNGSPASPPVPAIPGYPAVAPPAVTPLPALPQKTGSVPLDPTLRIRPDRSTTSNRAADGLTATGASLLSDLNPAAQIPIVQSYVYRDKLAAGCNAQSVLTAGSDVLGVVTTSTDGRERLALTFTSNQYLLQAHLLAYGLFRWASRGLFLGEQRHSLNMDVDDWFNSSDEEYPDGTINVDPGFRLSGHDAYNAYLQQNALRSRYPQASAFTFGMAYNGGDADLRAGSTCYPNGGINQLTST